MEALNTQLLQFFDWLLWVSLQGSILIVLIVLAQLILRRRLPIRWHYFIWLLLLIRLAMPWLPESRISIFNLVPKSIQQGRIIGAITESDDVGHLGFYSSMQPTDAQETQPEEVSESVFIRFVRMLPLLWLVGTVVMAGYVCVRNISLWLTVKRERPITDQKILELLENCKMEMGVQTILGVVVSDRIKSPALFGFIRHRLLLAQSMLETYGLEELRYVFIHELAHLRQRDIYLGWLMALLQIVHWFNPLMWIAFHRMRTDRELACDRLAILMMDADESPKYGRTIVNLLENFSQVRYLPSVAGILEDTCQIERRIKMIADYKKTSRSRWAGAILLLVVLACVVLTNAYVAKADLDFSTPTNLGPTVNSSAWDLAPNISADGLELFFISTRPGGSGDADIWVTTRATKEDDWGNPVNLGPTVNTLYGDDSPSISSDGSTLYFDSDRSGGSGTWDIWQVSIVPVVDLNGDGKVDFKDFRKLAQYWGQDEPSCDIAPLPFGDGIVDIKDLNLFAEYLLKEFQPVAHWKLDETEGTTAHDSMGDNDGTLHGEPVWQPIGGKVGGALQFDGIDDYVSTPFILDPAKGSFSAFAWINGGAPGQVIISQMNTTDGRGTNPGSAWLWADSSYGRLITRLMHPPFDPLVSESVITDGQWHHVGLVYDFDGLKRCLYVDGAEVAKDTDVVGGVGSDGGLYFGAGKMLDASSFFSGFIDDVRIYDRVLSAEEIAELGH